MIPGTIARKRLSFLSILIGALALVSVPQGAIAATAAAAPPAAVAVPAPAAADTAAIAPADAAAADSGYTPLGPEWIKGQPSPGGWDFQKQYSPTGHFAHNMHAYGLMPIITAICLLVLFLLLFVMVRFRKSANPVPSKTSHNTFIEIVWTVIPVLILVAIAVPSIMLLRDQYASPPKDALTVKVTGYQWYWGYSYPDNGDFEVISNMLPDDEAVQKGLPPQLAVDHRMVVPAGEWIRIQTTGADVIHSFAVPSLWFKLDAVPGRLNEKKMFIEEPGIYYGQCSELCGARHGYMPIAVEALPRPQFEAWVRSQGGTLKGEEPAAAPSAPTPAATPASAEPGAPAAGEAPSPETPATTPATA